MNADTGSGRPGDPDRILPLLWRKRRRVEPDDKPTLGRRPRLSLDEVISAAVQLADSDGLGAVSMNRLASVLGVGTMTLYSYVPYKQVLIDLMVDEMYAERALPAPGEQRPEDWRAQVELYVDRTREMYHAHPWLRHLSLIRPPIGPGMLADQEYVLSAVAVIGLTLTQTRDAAEAISTYAVSAASIKTESAELERTTGQTNDAWWADRMLLWEEYFEEERHPTMTYVWNSGGFDSDSTEAMDAGHAFGLQRLLDGIEGVIADPTSATERQEERHSN